ncbi:hypothetical protein [Stenotrophomonas muris]|uniref:hypothetical protein n=1 Tax=Stenotrophomonas muris TaxID=2963283 RepID=UPI00383BA28A
MSTGNGTARFINALMNRAMTIAALTIPASLFAILGVGIDVAHYLLGGGPALTFDLLITTAGRAAVVGVSVHLILVAALQRV